MVYHRLLSAEHIHILHRWKFTDESSRTTVSGLLTEDIGKLAWQQNNDSFWVLKNIEPITWTNIAGESPAFVTKSNNFTAEPFGKYAIDVSTSPINVLLPHTPTAGDVMEFYDATANSDTNTITLVGNGNNIMGAGDNVTITTPGLYFKVIYFNATAGYRIMRLV